MEQDLIDTIMEFPMPDEQEETAAGRKGEKKKKKNQRKGKKGKDGKRSTSNPLLDDELPDDIDFGTAFAEDGIDLEDENVDVEGKMDDLERALDTVESSGPKWHKTTCVTLACSSCVC